MTEVYHDRARNLIVYRTDDPDRITRYVAQAKRINGEYVAVPIALENLQLLHLIDLPTVPIMEDYDWPILRGRKPLAHQKLAANFKVQHPRNFDLSDMGTMKTLSTCWAADWLMLQHAPGEFRALVIAPLSILSRVWGKTIFDNFLGRRTFQIVHGSPTARRKALAKPADFYIINFDGVGTGAHERLAGNRRYFELDGLSMDLRDRTDIRLAIVDEASAYRDSTTKRSKLAQLVFGGREYLWLLTGTPTPNGPDDAYGLSKLVNNAHGIGYTHYRNSVMVQLSRYKWIPRRGANELVKKMLSPSMRVDIKDIWDGPPLTTQTRDVDLAVEQKRLLRDLKNQYQILMRSGAKITPMNEASARWKALQICMGAVYDENHATHPADCAPRLAELRQVIGETQRKVLIFVPLTNVLDMLYRELNEYTRDIVDGRTPQAERNRILSDFQDKPDPRLLLVHPATVAHGLDLFAADTVLWWGPVDKTEQYLQGIKRAHRPGQKYPVTNVQLCATALEREIFRRMEANESLQGAFLDMVRAEGL